jgi:hypothetical protein
MNKKRVREISLFVLKLNVPVLAVAAAGGEELINEI